MNRLAYNLAYFSIQEQFFDSQAERKDKNKSLVGRMYCILLLQSPFLTKRMFYWAIYLFTLCLCNVFIYSVSSFPLSLILFLLICLCLFTSFFEGSMWHRIAIQTSSLIHHCTVSLDAIKRIVHRFNCITVNIDRTQHGIYPQNHYFFYLIYCFQIL